jgi:hypothetical protein
LRPRWRSRGRRRPTPHSLLPQRSEGRRESGFLVSRGMGGLGSPRDLSRGVVPQGKKVAMRRCGIGGRGEAGLRPDPSIEEAVWSGRRVTRKRRPWRRPAAFKPSSARPHQGYGSLPGRLRYAIIPIAIARQCPQPPGLFGRDRNQSRWSNRFDDMNVLSAPKPTIRAFNAPIPTVHGRGGEVFAALVRQLSCEKDFRPVQGSGWIGRWRPFPRPA